MKVSSVSPNTQPNFGGLNMQKMLTRAANINSWQQRAALGAAAMTMQPLIDLTNKDVDEETRKISANRSFAKGLVGTATGIVVRGGCMKGLEKLFENETITDSLARLTAKGTSEEAIEKSKDFIKNHGGAQKYASVIGTIVAIGVMLFTNFLIDAPVTNWLTNKMNKKYEGEKTDKTPSIPQTQPKVQLPEPKIMQNPVNTPQNNLKGGV